MRFEAISNKNDSVPVPPIMELLACSPVAGDLLSSSTQCLDFDSGDVVFRQSEGCKGMYLVLSGQFLRKVKQHYGHITLGAVHAGELVELGAVLGDGQHTYTLSAQNPGAVILLPKNSLDNALMQCPDLRMQLLQELAREVSRSYMACTQYHVA